MQLMQRLNPEAVKDNLDTYVQMFRAHPGAVDNVWLGTQYGYPKIETHREVAELAEKQARRFRETGFSVSLQLSNSIGHGEYMSSRDCSGLVYDGSPAGKLVGHDGAVANYCFCYRGAFFRRYLLDVVETYVSRVRPDVFWIDDDFRAVNHAPVWYGCFCDDCVSAFNHLHGTNYDRASLVEEMTHGDKEVRRRYIRFVRASLYDLMADIGRTVRAASPDTVMGYQHGQYGTDHAMIFDAMKDATGKAPYSRPGGGAYSDHNPMDILDKRWEVAFQNSRLPAYVRHRCPEIENLPFTAFGKSPAGTAFETSVQFAGGNTDMTYSMIRSFTEPGTFYEREFALLSSRRPYWEKLTALNENTRQAGIRVFFSRHQADKDLAPGEGFPEMSNECFRGMELWDRDAIPMAMEDETSVFVLHPAQAKVLSEEEFASLASSPVITDGESVEILAKRGFSVGVLAERVDDKEASRVSERFSRHPVVPEGFDSYTYSFFVPGSSVVYAVSAEDGTPAEVLGKYYSAANLPLAACGKTAELIARTPQGGKWAVLGYMPWKGIISVPRRDMILNIADAIGKCRLSARVESPVQAVLLPRKNAEGKTVAVSVIHVSLGESGKITLRVRDAAGDTLLWYADGRAGVYAEPDGAMGGAAPGTMLPPVPLTAAREGDDVVVTLPSMAAFTVGTVFLN